MKLPARLTSWWLIPTALTVLCVSASAEDSIRTWNFDGDMPGSLPRDFVVGTLVDGRFLKQIGQKARRRS